MATLREDEIWSMLEKFHVCMATTLDGQTIRSRPMAPHLDEGEGVIRFLTEASSPKVGEIEADHDINLAFSDPKSMNFVSVSGRASVSRDRALIKELWNSYADAWFEGGPENANVAVITVHPSEGQYWDGTSSTIAQLFEIAKAKVTGAKPDMGDSGKVRFA